MSAGGNNHFPQSTSRKEPATPANPNPKIKQRRTNFTAEIGTTICYSPSFTSEGWKKTPVTPPNPNRNPLNLVDGRLLHCRTNRNSDTAKKTQFPTDLIEEILLRLGVKSLLRFRCVSKQWFFLLSNQQFITRHLKIQTSVRTRPEFISQGLKDTNFAIGTLGDNVDEIRFRLLETNHLQLQPSEEISGFLGHCNGLVSVVTNRSSIIVWNPLTLEQRRCPMPQRCPMDKQLFGFGYNSVSNDYKLVAATTPAFARTLGKIQSFSLKTGLWKTAQCDVEYFFRLSPEAKHLNDCIYWLISREGRYNCAIVSFDLSTDRLREEESASLVLSTSESKASIGLDLLGESLCLIVTDDEVIYDVWMMEENVVKHTKSWIKLFSVSSSDGNFNTALDDPSDAMTPVCFIGNRKVLIFWHLRSEYVLYDPGDQSVNKVAELGNPFVESWPVSPYVESLVSLGR